MSASAIIDGFINSLSAASVLGACNISKDYRVLERATACCMVVSWTDFGSSETAFGGQEDYTWTFLLEGFIKDTGDPTAAMVNNIKFIDVVASGLSNDRTIQGTVTKINEVRASRVPGVALQNNSGITFLPINVEVEVVEYDYS